MFAAYHSPQAKPAGTTAEQLQKEGWLAHLARILKLNFTGLRAPSLAPAVDPTGGGTSGGNLAPGWCVACYTLVNGYGETPPSPLTAPFQLAIGSVPRFQFPELPNGATGRKLYLGGSADKLALYANAISAVTFDASKGTFEGAAGPPKDNSTSLPDQLLGSLHDDGQALAKLYAMSKADIEEYLAGHPITKAEVLDAIHSFVQFAKVAVVALEEAAGLIAAAPVPKPLAKPEPAKEAIGPAAEAADQVGKAQPPAASPEATSPTPAQAPEPAAPVATTQTTAQAAAPEGASQPGEPGLTQPAPLSPEQPLEQHGASFVMPPAALHPDNPPENHAN